MTLYFLANDDLCVPELGMMYQFRNSQDTAHASGNVDLRYHGSSVCEDVDEVERVPVLRLDPPTGKRTRVNNNGVFDL